MAITRFNRAVCKQVQTDAVAALQTYAASLGLSVTPGRGKFTDTSLEMKIVFTPLTTADGLSGAEAEFRRKAVVLGVDPDVYGKAIAINVRGAGRIFVTITGINERAWKTPIIAKSADGRSWRLPVERVL